MANRSNDCAFLLPYELYYNSTTNNTASNITPLCNIYTLTTNTITNSTATFTPSSTNMSTANMSTTKK